MSGQRTGFQSLITNILVIICILSLLVSCQSNPIPIIETSIAPSDLTKLPDYPRAEVTFEAELPGMLQEGENLFLEILDEVTGLALNAARVQMVSEDQQIFEAKLPVVVGSVLKYRYVRDKEPVGIEYTSLNRQVRYRLHVVDGPGVVRDTISAWRSTPAEGADLGRIFGQVALVETNAPAVNALVVAGGMHTLTASDGSFILEGLPPGIHHMVVYSLDGSFRTFQQDAVIASNSTTPAFIQVQPARMVSVTFLVRPPADGLDGVPIRLVGNTLSLGNTFADLKGGVSVVASRAPMMELQLDGRYRLTVKLPAGSDLRYKYTLGDGYWNTEHIAGGGVRLRQLIVPNRNTTIRDAIDTWKTGNHNPISFNVVAPPSTPASDSLSIQFNPFGWTEAVPMWPAGNNRWFYVLYDPLNQLSGAAYRYCRNDQCGTADTVETSGAANSGQPFPDEEDGPTIEEQVADWAWVDAETEPVVVPDDQVNARENDFLAGVALLPEYHPGWQPYLASAFKNIHDIGANSVILSPTWQMTHQNPPVIEPVPGADPLWFDLISMAGQAQQNGLSVSIHPVLQYREDPAGWWSQAARDDGWWQSWFDRYRTFLVHHADLAAQTGAKALIIGDASILPALPGGTLVDGTSSNLPGNADERWEKLIGEVRKHYNGKLVWYIPYAGKLPILPTFLESVDQIYVEIYPPVSEGDQADMAGIEKNLAARVDEDILKLHETTNQAVMLGLFYPSLGGAADGCAGAEGECIPPEMFQQPASEYPGGDLSFKEQANVYSAVLAVLNQRPWVSGFYSAGYYPPVGLKDMSASIRGKPASDVLWYWYARLLGRGNQ